MWPISGVQVRDALPSRTPLLNGISFLYIRISSATRRCSLVFRRNEIRATSQPDSARVPHISTPAFLVPAQAPLVAPVPPVVPPPRILN
ncbi:hypothetical protein H5410_022667 [Solanum commersonii]|uniref:Uncharacterized protein n=1 Tax=Solanum commersonii TaxID=4109 RepID=A0A9J5ZFF5_SOLCO|nr:hypothetical protein H5410_022667 [Solanum commersonii]